MVLMEVSKEGMRLKSLMGDLGYALGNLSAILLAKHHMQCLRTKYIDVKYHFLCTKVRIEVKKIEMKENPANVFMKLIPRSKFMHSRIS